MSKKSSHKGFKKNNHKGTKEKGSNGDDVLTGTDGDDKINGHKGNDTLFGLAGRDKLKGGKGDDTLIGGDGDDKLDGGKGDDTLDGGAGRDKLKGGKGDDTLFGGDGDDKLDGGKGDDTLEGGAGNDRLKGGKGNDVLDGGTGNDVLEGGEGADTLEGGDGDDILEGGEGADTLNSGAGNDILEGGEGADSLFGGDGDDVLEGGEGNDFIDGGAGEDTAVYAGLASEYTIIDNGDGSITVIHNSGDDGDGTDTLSGVERLQFADQVIEIEPVGDPVIIGTPGDDILDGSAGNDEITGGGGNDQINAGAGDDVIIWNAGDGSDVIDGGADFDTLQINGSSGGDIFSISPNGIGGALVGIDGTFLNVFNTEDIIIEGGAGADVLTISGDLSDTGIAPNTIFFNGGADDDEFDGSGLTSPNNVVADGGAGNDTLIGGAGNDTLIGGDGDDFLDGGDGQDLLVGGAGNDTLTGSTRGNVRLDFNMADYRDATGSISVNLLATGTVTGDASVGTDTLINIDRVNGSDFDDTFTADSTASGNFGDFNEFVGGGGNDTITGNGNTRVGYNFALDGVTVNLDLGTAFSTNTGDSANIGIDTIISGVNNIQGSNFADILIGSDGSGFEAFRGRGGDDFIDGGGGSQDRADYRNSPNGVVVNLSNATETISGFNVASGQALDGFGSTDTLVNIERIRGSENADILIGDDGNNQIRGQAGNDLLIGGDGDDLLRGGNDDDTLEGGAGDDDLRGENGNDTLLGGDGNDRDTLDGGTGNDFLDGGTGNNTLIGGSGDDTLTGGTRGFFGRGFSDFNVANYQNATGGITVTLSGVSTVVGDASVGTDTLINIDNVRGTQFNDIFTADAGWSGGQFGGFNGGALGTFNEFQGGGGNDTITGNGFTRLSLRDGQDAGAGVGVTVTFTGIGAGTATGAGIGTDTFTGVNRINASNFDDVLTGNVGNEDFRANAGNDTIDGGGGIDRADYRTSAGGVNVDLSGGAIGEGTAQDGFGSTDTLSGIENIRGSEFDDVITGDAGANRFQGRDGNDQLFGGDGNDVLEGDLGDDTLDGGTGTNILIGGAGNDFLTGGTNGNGVVDFNIAGYGDATASIAVTMTGDGTAIGSVGTVIGDASVGSDTLGVIDRIVGTNFADTFTIDSGWLGGQFSSFGGGATGTFNEIQAGGGNDIIIGNGFVRVSYRDASEGVTVTLTTGGAGSGGTTSGADGGIGVDAFVSGVKDIRGSDFDDILLGNDANNAIRGQAGNDLIAGEAGFDRSDYRNSDAAITVDYTLSANDGDGIVTDDGFGDTDTLTSIEQVRGSQFDDVMTGDAGANEFRGEAGADTLNGGSGNDTLRGGNDDDTLIGGAGDDNLRGDGGIDTAVFSGGLASYIISGSGGSVTVTDLSGADGTDSLGGVEFLEFADQTLETNNLNVAPLDISLSNSSVQENADGAIIGTVSVIDPNAGDSSTITVSDGRFEVVSGQLKLKAGETLNFEAESAVALDITAIDTTGLSRTETFSIAVGDVNEAPVAVADTDGTTQNAAISVDVLANDTDVDGSDNPATFSLDGATIRGVAGQGAVSIIGNQLSFDPGTDFDSLAAGEPATVIIDYTMSDSSGVSSASTATITVTGTNDGPTANADSVGTDEDTAIAIPVEDLLINDTDPDTNDTLSISAVATTSALGAAITFDALTGIITYDPAGSAALQSLSDGEVGSDSFTYTLSDGNGGTAPGTVTVTVNGANDVIIGTPNADVLIGTDGIDSIFGLDGNDLLVGGDGDDFLDGGLGQDVMVGGAGNDTLTGAVRGDNALDYNQADYGNATGAINVTLSAIGTVTGDASVGTDTLIAIDRVFGTEFNDVFTADSTASGNFGDFNEFDGNGGDDTITGNGNTRISYIKAQDGVTVNLGLGTAFSTNTGDTANVGVDTFTGVNAVRGSNFNDVLIGGDTGSFEAFRGQAGDDFIDGGGGSQDRADYRNSPNGVFVDLSGGAIGEGTALDGYGSVDTLVNIERVRGSENADTIIGDAGNNQLRGQAGNDQLFGGGGNDTLRGGNDDDQIEGGTENDNLRGDSGNDTLLGGDGFDSLNGGSGNDTMDGGADGDFLFGGSGDDIINGGTGFDFLDGGAGNDTLIGGDGSFVFDTANYSNDPGSVIVNLSATTQFGVASGTVLDGYGDTDTLININNIGGSNFGDIMLGGVEGEVFRGEAGDDVIDGGAGFDSIDFFSSTDGVTVNLNIQDGVAGQFHSASQGTDIIQNFEGVLGSFFDDNLTGDGGSNFLEGRDGNDRLEGGGGFDNINAGDGTDTAVFSGALASYTISGSGANVTVTDLIGGDGTDTLSNVEFLEFADQTLATNNLDVAPLDISLSNSSVQENADGAVIGAVSVVDVNAGDSSTITVSDGRFEVVSGQLKLKAGETLNFEAEPNVSLDITATDTTGLTLTETFSIAVGDANDAPSANPDSDGTDEDTAIAISVADLLLNDTDPDTSDTLSISSVATTSALGAAITFDALTGTITYDPTGTSTLQDLSDGDIEADTFTYTLSDGNGGTDTGTVTVTVNGANDVIIGTPNVDVLVGTGGNDSIFGLEDNDQLFGGDGDDLLDGGDGQDVMIGGAGNDTLTGGTGGNQALDFNTADYQSATGSVAVTLSTISTVVGDASVGTDTLLTIDRILGTAFDDTFTADANWAGSQFTAFPNGALGVFNEFQGGGGNDTITGNGHTRVSYRDATDGVTVTINDTGGGTAVATAGGDAAGIGIDTFTDGVGWVRGSNFDDVITGGAGQESIRGQAGNDIIDGGGGTDRLDYRNSPNGVVVNLSNATETVSGSNVAAGQALDGFGFTDTISNMENVKGSENVDYIIGDSASNRLEGRGGDDHLFGGAGDDRLQGDVGNDTLDGGSGFDTADYRFSTAGITGTMSSTATVTGDGSVGTDTLTEIARIFGTDFDDTFTVDGSFSTTDNGSFFEVRGGGGNDTITGNGNTRVSYFNADAGVTVTFTGSGVGTAVSTAPGDTAGIGIDTFTGVNSVRGSNFDDTIIGNAGFQSIRARGGDDFIDGGSGGSDEARYSSASGSVIADLGTNNQTTQVTIQDGFGGTDTLIGIERLRGGSSNDELRGDVNNNRLRGGSGDDILEGRGGNDDLRGESGFDTASYESSTLGVTVDLGAGTATGAEIGTDTLTSIENALGGSGNDTLIGGSGNNFLDGGTGNNTLIGGAGNDTLTGAIRGDFILDFNTADYRSATGSISVTLSGTSTVVGDASVGTDTLLNIDRILGTAFNDVFTADGGWSGGQFGGYDGGALGVFNEFQGGGGNDTITGNGFTRISVRDAGDAGGGVGATVTFTGVGTGTATGVGIGTDTFTGTNRVRGSNFDDQLTGNIGNEDFRGQGGNDTIDGGGGFDRADYRNSANGINADLSGGAIGEGSVQDGFGTTDTLFNIENIRGSEHDDVIIGDAGGNRLEGRDGRDRLEGGAGNDFLDGGTGNNTLIGGAGNDTLTGSAQGSAVFDFNQADYRGATGSITVTLSSTSTVVGDASVDTDTLLNIDRVLGTTFNDVYTADGGWSGGQFGAYGGGGIGSFNEFQGGAGDDTINGSGFTRISLSDAQDAGGGVGVTVTFTGIGSGTATGVGIGTDTFSGVSMVRGSNFDDTLTGNIGNEDFRAQAGSDTIDGGGGNDRADYRNSSNGIDADLSGGAIGEGTVQDGFGSTDTLSNIENIRGSEHNDVITGDAGANMLQGQGGDDHILGGGGDDILVGDKSAGILVDVIGGNDTLDGGAGNDTLNGDDGDDILTGGADSDTFVFGANAGDDTITDFDLVDDILLLEDGVGLSGTSETDANGDTITDTVVALDDGGSVTLLGVSGIVDPNDLFT